MKPAPFSYARAQSLDEALGLFASADGEAKYLAGGQTLGPMINLRLTQPDMLIDISRLDDLRKTDDHGDGVFLGSAIRHAEIEDRKIPDPSRGLLGRAAEALAYRAIRNRGTIGGSISHADPVAEWPNVLTALDATVHLRGPDGARTLPMSEFIVGYLTTALSPEEIVLGVDIPRLGDDARTGYAKFCRKSGEFAHSLAVTVIKGQTARCVLGCAASTPLLLTEVGELAASLTQWRDGAKADIVSALDADCRASDVTLDRHDLRTHAAVVERSIRDAVGS